MSSSRIIVLSCAVLLLTGPRVKSTELYNPYLLEMVSERGEFVIKDVRLESGAWFKGDINCQRVVGDDEIENSSFSPSQEFRFGVCWKPGAATTAIGGSFNIWMDNAFDSAVKFDMMTSGKQTASLLNPKGIHCSIKKGTSIGAIGATIKCDSTHKEGKLRTIMDAWIHISGYEENISPPKLGK